MQVRSPHETDSESDSANSGDSTPRPGSGQPTSAAQESAMVRAAMAMGARVVAEEDVEGADGTFTERSE